MAFEFDDDDDDFEQPMGSELGPDTNAPPLDPSAPRKPPPAAPAFEPREFGPYLLLKKCGEGAMGQVFLTEERELNRIVALKLIHPRQLGDQAESAIKRFRREGKALARTSHANVIGVHRCAREGETWFLEMEYFESIDLHQLIVNRKGEPFSLGQACHFLIQAADGLAHAHGQKIIHRDVKPSNLLVNAKLVLKVTDFGLAKIADDSYTVLTHNNTGALGTPDYMSPEQFQDARTIDARSDIYSLGCVLYFLAVGRHPFADKVTYANKMLAHLTESPPPLRAVRPEAPRSLENVYLKMLAKSPEQRFQSMAEVADALRPLLVRKSKTPASLTNSVGMTLLPIPAGEFLMGSPDDEMAFEDEKPQRQVRVDGFLMAAHPVTQAQYQAVVGANPSAFSPTGIFKDRIQGPTGQHPVECVSWFDAIAFCNKLSVREKLAPYYQIEGETVTIAGGTGYRLPFEREWEYACRAGTTTRYFFGDSPDRLKDYAWYGESLATGTTHPVGLKAANPWGLHDMLGNAWEWCWDWYDGIIYSYEDLFIFGPKGGDSRVLRGGSYYRGVRNARPAFRNRLQPAFRSRYCGFRVARALP